jgi:hypothetical protein
MLVWESRDACNFVCTVAKSSIRRLSRPIPNVEFSPTNSPENEGKLFIHSNPLEQVHIVYTSMTKLSLVERLVLLHLLGATGRNVIVVRGHRNVIVCVKVVLRHFHRCCYRSSPLWFFFGEGFGLLVASYG